MLVKVCGLNNTENLIEVLGLKPDFVGHIFYRESPRNVEQDFLKQSLNLDYGETKKVAVFVNKEIETIREILKMYSFDFVQLHGDESPEECSELSESAKVIKAFGLNEEFSLDSLSPYQGSVDYFLFDTKSENYGGSGKTFSWDLLEGYSYSQPYFLSGGINPDNFKAARDFCDSHEQCYALDLILALSLALA